MKITDLHIYGFGKWTDFKLHMENPYFTVIVGDNEAGKSTLRHFMLFVLFGLPPKMREFYQPKTGGTIGGRLTLIFEDGQKVSVERVHDKRKGAAICQLSDGEEREESFLYQKIGIDRSVFESVFSFEAADLIELHQVNKEKLGETLLSVGLTGSSEINRTEGELQQSIGELFKPQGKKPLINVQLKELEKMADRLADLEQEEQAYRQLKEEKEQLESERDRLLESLESDQKDRRSCERILQAEEIITAFHQHASADTKERDGFPVDGRKRLEDLKVNMLPIESEKRFLEETEAQYRQKRDELKSRLITDEQLREMKRLTDQTPVIRHDLLELEKLEDKKKKSQTLLEHELEEMAIDLSVHQLAEYEFPFYKEEEWGRLARQKERLSLDTERGQDNLLRISKEQQELETQKKQQQTELLEEEAYRHFSAQLDEYEREFHTRNDGNISLANSRHKAKLIFRSSLIISLLGMTVAGILSSWPVAIVSLVLALGGFAAYRQTNVSLEKGNNQSLSQSISEQEAQKLRQKVSRHEEAFYKLKTLEEKELAIASERMKQEEQIQALDEQKARILREINHQINSYPFLKGVEPDYWVKLFHLVKSVKTKYNSLQDLDEEISILKEKLPRYEEEVDMFLANVNWEYSGNSLGSMLDELETVYSKTKQNHTEWESQENMLKEIHDKKARLVQQLVPYREEKEKLFLKAGTTDEDEFLRVSDQVETVRYHKKKQEELKSQIIAILPEDVLYSYNILEQVPSFTQLAHLEQEKSQLIRQREMELEQLRQRLADINSRIHRLENTDTFSDGRFSFQTSKDELESTAHEWAVLQVAKSLLEETKRVYQKKYLPEILNHTSRWFGRLTAGLYQSVRFDSEDGELVIRHRDGWNFHVSELSRGTSDQLYIALRLALSMLISRKNQLPFFIDDAFVHFDATRTDEMLEILKELSDEHQVIFFTWRKDLVHQSISLSEYRQGEITNSI
ncbi:ATP-binding protein [Thalassobacillus pellis]|uniref:ATP-binding protein n=1 Tax=Thalassobacillus pellis TaxID=748008 RepID=UPI00195F955C|nr:AAA family ATPase [Thalassobacillus pellis]MBM7554132.1 uncharacterized protein YhaN [Thalassobacillus pellis]